MIEKLYMSGPSPNHRGRSHVDNDTLADRTGTGRLPSSRSYPSYVDTVALRVGCERSGAWSSCLLDLRSRLGNYGGMGGESPADP